MFHRLQIWFRGQKLSSNEEMDMSRVNVYLSEKDVSYYLEVFGQELFGRFFNNAPSSFDKLTNNNIYIHLDLPSLLLKNMYLVTVVRIINGFLDVN